VREKENLIRFCAIKDAKTGIVCQSSSPRIEDCELTANIVGMKVTGAFSRPYIVRNAVHKNDSTGILIDGGSQPTLIQNKIRNNTGGGIKISNAEPVIKQNTIIQNSGSGVKVHYSQASITENNIYDNNPFDMAGAMTGDAVKARDNWWGNTNGLDILSKIRGKIDIRSVLNGPYPEGKSLDLPILDPGLGGMISSDSYLTLSNSPYKVIKDLLVDNGSILYIELLWIMVPYFTLSPA